MLNFKKERSIIKINEVFKSFKQGTSTSHVLSGVNAIFEQDKTYILTGVSGTGKSTLIHLLAGLDIPTSGKVCIDELDMNDLSSIEKQMFLYAEIGLIFQSPYLIHELSVKENIMIRGLIGNESYQQAQEKAISLLKQVGLFEKAENSPSELSGGQQQRVAIARALFNEPSFLLADEPTAHLDEKTKSEIIQILRNAHKEFNMGLIIATHDMSICDDSDIILELKEGKLIQKKI